MKCPYCDASSNDYGVWLGYGRIKCLNCKWVFSVAEMAMDNDPKAN